MIESESGFYAVTVDNMISMLSKAYISLVESNTPFRRFPSVMLWGAPGVGKSRGGAMTGQRKQRLKKQLQESIYIYTIQKWFMVNIHIVLM